MARMRKRDLLLADIRLAKGGHAKTCPQRTAANMPVNPLCPDKAVVELQYLRYAPAGMAFDTFMEMARRSPRPPVTLALEGANMARMRKRDLLLADIRQAKGFDKWLAKARVKVAKHSTEHLLFLLDPPQMPKVLGNLDRGRKDQSNPNHAEWCAGQFMLFTAFMDAIKAELTERVATEGR